MQSDAGAAASPTDTPIVGVLCIDVATPLSAYFGQRIRSYIAASYVKHLEAQGARVVPIWLGRTRDYYAEIMRKLNGVLLPGGAVYLRAEQATAARPNACVQSAAWILEIAVQLNAAGVHFPVWGTCLGFQLMLLHLPDAATTTTIAGEQPNGGVATENRLDDFRVRCAVMQHSLPLHFEPDWRDSRLFACPDEPLWRMASDEPVAYHFHRFCITREAFETRGCQTAWRLLATQTDVNGLEFITIVEHKRYPLYGVQFHPERAAYECLDTAAGDNCAHTPAAVRCAHHFMAHFVRECRKSKQRFPNYAQQLRHLICNFAPTFTANIVEVRWLQCYLFAEHSDYPPAP